MHIDKFPQRLSCKGLEILPSHHPDGGRQEGGEDEEDREVPRPDGLLHQDRGTARYRDADGNHQSRKNIY